MRAGMLVGVLIAGTALVSLPGMASAMVSAGDGPAVLGQGPAPANAPATRTAVAPAVEPVDWQPCPSATLSGVAADQQKTYSCATYRVPIDHGNAALGTIDIALLKRAAKTPGKKIGSLFLNPGGPGGSGLKMPISAQSFLQPDVLDRFDTIGFDPRGVGASNPLRCFTTKEDSDDVFGGMMPEPSTRDEISTELAAYQDYAQFCRTNAGALLDHMSTKDVARDLDTLRAAVGDEKLTYVGFSYGTLIGATYAAMFGKQTRAMVLDGNVDPALRTSDGTRYDRERAKGTEASLNGFLSKCQQVGPKCAFAAGEQPRQKFDELRTYLRQQPIKLPDGSAFDLNMFTSAVAGTLYSTPDFPCAGHRPAGALRDNPSRPGETEVGGGLQAADTGKADAQRLAGPGSGQSVRRGRLVPRRQLLGQEVHHFRQRRRVHRRDLGSRVADLRPVPGVRGHGGLLGVAGQVRRLHRPVAGADRQPGARGRQLPRPGHAVQLRPADGLRARVLPPALGRRVRPLRPRPLRGGG
jgi:pimeloyl-ACP methyl ester carboxylesterase